MLRVESRLLGWEFREFRVSDWGALLFEIYHRDPERFGQAIRPQSA